MIKAENDGSSLPPMVGRPSSSFPDKTVWLRLMPPLSFSILLVVGLLTPSLALAVTEYQGKVIRVMDGESSTQHPPCAYRLSASIVLRSVNPMAREAKQATSALVFGKQVTLQTTARTGMGAPLDTCSWRMERMSIVNSSNRAGAGGIASMRRGILNLRS